MGQSWLFGPFFFFFFVTTDDYWGILIRFGLWHTYAPNYLFFILFVYAG